MSWLYLLWIVGIGIIIYKIYQFFLKSNRGVLPDEEVEEKTDNFSSRNYELRDTLMSPSERLFFEKLRRAIGDQYDIYPQVNLDKIFKTKYQANKYAFNGAKWAIDRRSVDFLITLRDTQRPYVGIELDDSSHSREDRISRDEKINALFKDNGIDLIRFNTSDNYLEDELRKIFERHY